MRRSGGPPEVDSQVVPVRPQGSLQTGQRLFCQVEQIQPLGLGDRFDSTDVTIRNDHQVSVVIGKTIEHRESQASPDHHVIPGISPRLVKPAEDASNAGGTSGLGDVSDPPRSPKPLRGHSTPPTRPAEPADPAAPEDPPSSEEWYRPREPKPLREGESRSAHKDPTEG